MGIRITFPPSSHFSDKNDSLIGRVIAMKQNNSGVELTIKGKEKVIVYYYGKVDSLSLGDKVLVRGEFFLPSVNTTRYLFNFREYLKRKGIFYLVSASSITVLKKNQNPWYAFREFLFFRLHHNPYLHTFLLGDKSLISSSVMRSYQANGISHLFAISGMHISLLSGILCKILKRFFDEKRIYFVTSCFLLFYLCLVGLLPSITRGVLFFLLFHARKIYSLPISKVGLFSFIVSLSLFLDPYSLFDIGYQYSYLISFSFLIFSSHLSSKNYFLSLFKVSFCAFLVSIPISLFHFYEVNVLGIFYNLFFVPLVSFLLFPLSLIVFFVGPLEEVYLFLVNILESVSLFLADISFFKFIFMRIPTFFYFLYVGLLFLFFFFRKKRFIVLFFLVLGIHYFLPFFSFSSSVEVLDVGQGDAILLRVHGKNILMDTGGVMSFDSQDVGVSFYHTILPVLKMKGIHHLDYFIITHGDFDHCGDAISLIENYSVRRVIFNVGDDNFLESRIKHILEKKKIPYYKNLEAIRLGDERLFFLNTGLYDNENDNSNVVYIEIDGFSFLFMGDASNKREADILDNYDISHVDVLKVGHHGSDTSSSKEFIDAIHPRYSVISVGRNNRYHHPSEKTLENLKKSKIYRTDLDGSILFQIRKKKLVVSTGMS